MDSLIALILISLAAVFVYVTVWFVMSRILKRNDVADVAWGPGIFVVALVGFMYGGSALITALIGIWALRLAGRILARNIKKEEDRRYVELRRAWGKWDFLISYLQVFLLQGLLMVFVGYGALHAAAFGMGWVPFVLTGALVWVVGFVFETVGDYQLDQFLSKKENKGKIMRYGLWKYTRHPNYFGEVTQWWGIFIMLIGSPLWFFGLISPITITILILGISGIPMLEKGFVGNPEWEAYKKRTSAFFPFFPRGDS